MPTPRSLNKKFQEVIQKQETILREGFIYVFLFKRNVPLHTYLINYLGIVELYWLEKMIHDIDIPYYPR